MPGRNNTNKLYLYLRSNNQYPCYITEQTPSAKTMQYGQKLQSEQQVNLDFRLYCYQHLSFVYGVRLIIGKNKSF